MSGDESLHRVRRICTTLPGTTEKLSHGEPTFFVNKRVYAMFSNNHHNDGHVAVLIPTEPGAQQALIATSPDKYYYPKYVGVSGWVGIEVDRVGDDELREHLLSAWRFISNKKTAAKKRAKASR